MAVGYVRHREILFPNFPDHHLRSVMVRHERIWLEGWIKAEPERVSNRHRWLIRTERIWHPTGAEEISGDLQLSVRAARRDWRYGDRIRFWIRPNLPQNSGNPGGFEYATYLSQRQIYVTGFLDNDAEIELLAREPGAIRGRIEDIRRTIRRYIDAKFSPDGGALMKALTVGEMGGISKEVRSAFTAAGVNHVLSISGLHVAMLGVVIFAAIRYGLSFSSYLLLRFNLLKAATFFSFLAVVFYTALAGAMVPTVRSAIMIGVYQLAVLLDREEEVFASLTLAALVIALVWPGVIADISFQLSFLGRSLYRLGHEQTLSGTGAGKEPGAAARKELAQAEGAAGDLSFGSAAAGDGRHRAVDRSLFRKSVARRLCHQSFDRAASGLCRRTARSDRWLVDANRR